MLGWSQSDLAGHVGVSTKTVWVFEAGKPKPSVLNLDLVREALKSAGVIFVEENGEGPGVRVRFPTIPVLSVPLGGFEASDSNR